MYKEHESFKPPPPGAELWRYVDFTKFVSLLEKEALFFPNAATFSDSFEGSYPTGGLELVPEDYRPRMQANSKSMRRLLYVNCWHSSEFESEAMWRLYSAWDRGIAIKTTFDGLAKSLTCEADVYIGAVNYIDFGTGTIDETNAFVPYLTKRKSFEFEREVRAITLNAVPEDAEFLGAGADWAGTGIYYSADLGLLVDEVFVAPQSEDWFVDLVQAVVKRYGIDAPVKRSALADAPPWWVRKSERLSEALYELRDVVGEDFKLTTSSNAKVACRFDEGLRINFGDVESYHRLTS